jgi:hypothetical protein
MCLLGVELLTVEVSLLCSQGRYMVVSRLCHQTCLSLNQMRVSVQKHL